MRSIYFNSLMTINERGYTKHYFAEGERIASAIGGGGGFMEDPYYQIPTINGDYNRIQENYTNFVADCFINAWANTLPAAA
jgi:hypothetical protein